MARSNLAYDELNFGYEYNAVPKREHSSNLRIRHVQNDEPEKSKPANKIRTNAKAKKRANLSLVLLALAAFLVLCRGVAITEKSDQLDKRRKELDAIITSNQKAQIEIDSALNLKNVEEIASTRLNMARPEKNQTIYIKIAQNDFVEKTDAANAQDAVSDFFGALKAYLD